MTNAIHGRGSGEPPAAGRARQEPRKRPQVLHFHTRVTQHWESICLQESHQRGSMLGADLEAESSLNATAAHLSQQSGSFALLPAHRSSAAAQPGAAGGHGGLPQPHQALPQHTHVPIKRRKKGCCLADSNSRCLVPPNTALLDKNWGHAWCWCYK